MTTYFVTAEFDTKLCIIIFIDGFFEHFPLAFFLEVWYKELVRVAYLSQKNHTSFSLGTD